MLTIARAKEISEDLLRPFGLKAAACNVRWAGIDGWRLEIIVAGYPAVSVETGENWSEESVRWDLLTQLRATLNSN
jgi:hypothetical protein